MSTSRHTLDMTVGSPAKLLFRFSLPLFLGNLLQQLYHLVDTAMAGHMLGDAALSQIGSTAALYSLITTLAFGLNSGFALTVSCHFGSGNKKSMERAVCWMTLLSALRALVMTAVFFSARAWLVDAMQIPADIRDGTLCYLTVILAGIPLSMAYNLESNMMQSVGNSVTPL
ncbi:MAG: MATE family efflux transporter, partial [Christensenellales bacterium]|nr:MATE family efflux transporter [Christensenellales bacterium]